MNKSCRFLWLFGALLFVSPIAAQETPEADPNVPTITKLNEYQGPPGTVINVFGSNFGTSLADVTANIGGKFCIVTEVLDTKITVISDVQTPLGKQQLKLVVGSTKLEPVNYEVLDPNNLPDDYLKKKTETYEASKRSKIEEQRRKLITLKEVKTVPGESNTTTVEVTGETKTLLPNSRVYVQLEFSKRPIMLEQVFIDKDKFKAVLGPIQQRLFPGRYSVQVTFLLHQQKRAKRDEYRSKFTKKQLSEIRSIHFDDFVDIGDPQTWKPEREKLANAYLEGVALVNSAVVDFVELYASTVRIAFRKGKAIDREAWKNWLAQNKMFSTEDEFKRIDKRRECIRGSHFNPDGWNKAMTETVTKLHAYYDRLTAFENQYIAVPWTRVLGRLQNSISGFINSIWLRSEFFYSRYKTLNMPESLVKVFSDFPLVSRVNLSFEAILAQNERTISEIQEELRRDRELVRAVDGAKSDAKQDSAAPPK